MVEKKVSYLFKIFGFYKSPTHTCKRRPRGGFEERAVGF